MNVFRLYFNYAGYITCKCTTDVLMCIVVIIVFLITANLHNTKCLSHIMTLHERALTHIKVIDDNYIHVCDIGDIGDRFKLIANKTRTLASTQMGPQIWNSVPQDLYMHTSLLLTCARFSSRFKLSTS